ncbi:helix-turn-helix domain-containing protein [Leucobacter sp. UCMA 4100]|uniref:helix-turn-helix domain-containing protein n=1 Tax=Leucobacter sp. UCMA 4100 TaxID=2810534 RepID=UPI0022EA7928|nr:helix-turn-helix domain-containing protein [Leucobacter sp. UCMA 4100]MDA3147535.1 helix-turn-helix domain-containing protein [Leucobacter sp. UCMA 4100]
MLPASTHAPVLLDEPALYAVLVGEATVRVGQATHTVTERSGLYVAAGETVHVDPRPGSIVIPVPSVGVRAASHTNVTIRDEEWPGLVHAFTTSLGHLDGPGAPVEVHGDVTEGLAAPTPPRSPELRALADAFIAHPSSDIATWLAETAPGWSRRTAQRRFVAETGLTISAWLRRSRVHRAAQHLTEARDLEWIAHLVGYQSVAGFIRAFADEAGMTPGQWRSVRMNSDAASARLVFRDTATEHRQRTWTRVNGAHVAVWAAVGEATLWVRGKAITLSEGEAAIIPAGMPNALEIPEGSLLIPVGFRSGVTGGLGVTTRAAMLGPLGSLASGDTGIETIASMLAAYTSIGAVDVHPDRGFATVLAGSALQGDDNDDALLASFASFCSKAPDVETSIAARHLGCNERTLHRIVADKTGEALPAWRRLSRMTGARNRLGEGARPSEISRDLGYAHLPAFSRAFREVHGASPASLDVPNLLFSRGAWGRWAPTPRVSARNASDAISS